MPYLKGVKLWPYISGTVAKPNAAEADKLVRWEQVDAQALPTILMNIAPNIQARLDCFCSKACEMGYWANTHKQTSFFRTWLKHICV